MHFTDTCEIYMKVHWTFCHHSPVTPSLMSKILRTSKPGPGASPPLLRESRLGACEAGLAALWPAVSAIPPWRWGVGGGRGVGVGCVGRAEGSGRDERRHVCLLDAPPPFAFTRLDWDLDVKPADLLGPWGWVSILTMDLIMPFIAFFFF